MNPRAFRNFGRNAIALAVTGSTIAACGLSVDDLFTSGAGGSGAGGAFTTSASSSASSASSSSSSASSSSSSSSSSSTSSSSGGAVCGDGICAPTESATFCPQDCAGSSSSSSSSSSSGTTDPCGHAACDTGDKFDAACSPCATAVCAKDPYCCMTSWDAQCVGEADAEPACGKCCGNGACNNNEDCTKCPADCGPCAPTASCAHSVCDVGVALDTAKCRDACVGPVCAQKPACCGNGSWNAECATLATQLCGPDPCVTSVCAAMPSCCTTGWTQGCVDKAKMLCQTSCDCAHPVCQMGGPLADNCSPCAKAACQADGYCCTSNWDGICVNEVALVCAISCQ